MDNQNNSTTSTFLPPPIDGEASAPLAQPDDDFVVPLSAAGTPNTPADDGGTGSTVSPVTPVHLNRQPHALMMDDDQAANAATDSGATDDNSVLLPPPEETDSEEKPNKDGGDDGDNGGEDNNENRAGEDDDQVPVLAMSGILPATATGGGPISDSKKNAGGPNDSLTGGAPGTGNGESKSKEKSRYTTGSGTGAGTDVEDSGTNNPQAALGCGTTFEYVVLVTACSILLLAVTGTTVYWTMAYRGGYDPNWFPWPPQTPKQMLSVGVFTYKHPQNFTAGGSDISTTTIATTTVEQQQQSSQLNTSTSNVLIEDRRFNLHPTLMTVGFVTLTGFSILVYRMAAGCSTSCRGTYVKLTHGLLHLATVPCVVLGAVAAMEYHRLKGLPHLYSLHSWMGLLTVSLFVIQFTLGLFTFVVLLCCRGATAACRLRCFAPIHATLGLCTFTLAIATCLTGLQQRADFSIFSNNNGQQKQHQQQQITLPPTASSSPSSLNSGELHGRALPQQAIINVLGVLLMMALVFVTVALLSQKKSCRRNSSSSLSPSTMRYCRNGGQSFQLVPSSPAAADGSDHGGRNGRM
ncbi:uncharacterized protein LOC114125279 isoform X1 [Aphis gossypii]|uniref:uncharacterized protein LOC114125279 isoform X1 n=1 Tax=Aphis gossypii TaxID=80765 RepID=UPI0021593122|nr:uncharacterized protein LOC114125279 isoform X1 [Aphis gossypii]